MKIIDRDIDFYTGCMENAKHKLIHAFPEDEKYEKEVHEIYSQIVLKLHHLRHLLNQEKRLDFAS